MTPHLLGEIRRWRGQGPRRCRRENAEKRLNMGRQWGTPSPRLTTRPDRRDNYTYYGFPIIPTRGQSRGLARPRRAPSASPGRPGPAVRLARLFRSAGSRAGEVRNAPPGGRRGPTRGANGRRVWVLAPDVLSDAGRLQATGDRRLGASETRAARRPQTRRRGDGLCGRARRAGPGAQRTRVAATDSRSGW